MHVCMPRAGACAHAHAGEPPCTPHTRRECAPEWQGHFPTRTPHTPLSVGFSKLQSRIPLIRLLRAPWQTPSFTMAATPLRTWAILLLLATGMMAAQAKSE